MPKIKILGPAVTAGEAVTDRKTDGQTDGNVGNRYHHMSLLASLLSKKILFYIGMQVYMKRLAE